MVWALVWALVWAYQPLSASAWLRIKAGLLAKTRVRGDWSSTEYWAGPLIQRKKVKVKKKIASLSLVVHNGSLAYRY